MKGRNFIVFFVICVFVFVSGCVPSFAEIREESYQDVFHLDPADISSSNEENPPYVENNILKNSDFEDGFKGYCDFWQALKQGQSDKIIFGVDTEVCRSGKTSVNIKACNISMARPVCWLQTVKSIPKGNKVVLSGYIKCEDLTGVTAICVHILNKEGKQIEFMTTEQGYREKFTSGWIYYEDSLIMPNEAESIFIMNFLFGSGKVWFDDVYLAVY